ncbi:hypothetical protein AcW1_008014 [Taiwanofungus camphoratus]|nr:hypothetical protein AcW1_008014 [Antrodia cinnamomea]KAI0955717.1 hypothetical protein AcV7_006306 [Antrodia cinnamomea]
MSANLVPSRDGSVPMDLESRKVFEKIRREHAIAIESKGPIDSASAYAMKEVDFMLIFWDKQFSRIECQFRVDTWNGAVDRYIALGKDKRSLHQIEVESKIGLDGGPLYKRCEGAQCNQIEGPNGDKMKCCSRCKRVYYCTKARQKADWQNHKQCCKDGSHPVQMLPSQEATREFLKQSLMKTDAMLSQMRDVNDF